MSEIKVNKISPRTNCGTVTLGDSGDTIALGSGASQTGFGRTGTVDWQTTVKTGNFTAVNGEGYFVDTTSGAITLNLPAGSSGAIVAVKDYAMTFDTNNLIISPNGSEKINGVAETAPVSTEGVSLTLVYIDSTKGWLTVNDATQNTTGVVPAYVAATGGNTTATVGDYKIHTFTGPGTFCVSDVGNSKGNNAINYLVVAGGGGGASASAGAGGAGGFRESRDPVAAPVWTASPLVSTTAITLTSAGAVPITVGGGGAGKPFPGSPTAGTVGSSSIFSTITSAGGGFGASGGGAGGSGGGSNNCSAGGTGNTPPVSPPQGNPGQGNPPGVSGGGGGGGGAGEAGGTDGNRQGGDGVSTTITNTPTTYAGGGGGGAAGGNTGGAGGDGGGGTGGNSVPGSPGSGTTSGTAGTANTGGGGGSGGYGCGRSGAPPQGSGANGGSGIVVIRYKFQN